MKKSPYSITQPRQTIFWTLISGLLLLITARHLIPSNVTEMLGFITGGACVWLLTKQNIWNWPIGIANAVFFLVLFWHARLFADSLLQVFYLVTGFIGWYWWLHGGKHKDELPVQKTGLKRGLIIAVIGVISTVLMHKYLVSVKDSAPFWDSITTVGSLLAQAMLTRKLIENWHLWMAVDVIYVGLYASRHLYLTSILYVIFFAMCISGLIDWQRDGVKTKRQTPVKAQLKEALR